MPKAAYRVDGTATAVHLRHRESRDLDALYHRNAVDLDARAAGGSLQPLELECWPSNEIRRPLVVARHPASLVVSRLKDAASASREAFHAILAEPRIPPRISRVLSEGVKS